MMKYFLFVIVLSLCISSAITQGYRFERVIECQNGQFQVVNSDKTDDANNMKMNTSIEQKATNSQQQTVQQAKRVRCKKWVQSYKLIQQLTSNLRTQQQQSQQQGDSPLPHAVGSLSLQPLHSIRKQSRTLLRQISQQTLPGRQQSTAADVSQQANSHVKSSISASSTSNSKNNEQFFLSMYMVLNMQQNVPIYQGS